MANTKQQLVELIEAYAAAKASNNSTLVSFAAASLQQILQTVTFAESTDDFGTEESQQPLTRRARKVAD